MATYTAPTTRTTGALISASIWNTDIVENLKYFKDAPVFDGDISVGDDIFLTSTGAVINFASGDVTITHSTNTLTFAGASSGYVFDDHLKFTVGKYLDWGTTVGSFGGRFGRYVTGSFLIGVPGTSASETFLVTDSAGATIAEFRGNKTVLNASTISVGGATPATTGAGVTFPAAQSASSDANTLDDYEEGTWTATLKGGTTDPTTPVTVTGNYTKIGRQVTITAVFLNVTTTGASGTVSVTGAPFSSSGIATGAAMCHTFDLNGGTGLTAYISGTTIELFSMADDAAWVQLRHNAGTNRSLWFTITYFV